MTLFTLPKRQWLLGIILKSQHNALFLSGADCNILHCFWHHRFLWSTDEDPAFSVEGTLSPSRSFATCHKLKLWNAFLNFERLSTAFQVTKMSTSPTGLPVLQPVGHRLRYPTVQVKRWVQTHTCRSKGSGVWQKICFFLRLWQIKRKDPEASLHQRWPSERDAKSFFDLVCLLESASKH